MRRSQHREPRLRTVARSHEDRLAALEFDANVMLNNERVNRSRIDTLEAFYAMAWYERVWWVLTGRCKYFTVINEPAAKGTTLTAATDAAVDESEAAAMAAPETVQ